MSRLPPCLLYSQDADLVRRVTGLLSLTTAVRWLDELPRLEDALERSGGDVTLMDLRAKSTREALPSFLKAWPHAVFVALGTPGSEPVLDAEAAGVYAVEDLKADGHRLKTLVARALDHLALLRQNRVLQTEAARGAAIVQTAPHRGHDAAPLMPARHFPGALRHVDNVEGLLQSLVEGVAGSLMVARVGIFCRARDSRVYRLRGGLRCLEDTDEIEYTERDPLVHWLTLHAHMVSRSNLEHIRDGHAQLLLTQNLDALGAEVIVPLQARDKLLGWLFLGRRSTGLPFDEPHLENLVMVAEHVSTTIENALLYEEVAVQKTLAETLLHSIPTGIVAVDENGVVRWFNDVAQQVLETAPEGVLNQRVEVLGSRLADVLRRALKGDTPEHPAEWAEPRTKRTLAVLSRQLMNNGLCLGAMALIQDVTVERMLEEKEEQLERAQFWTELAASMSHEVRNPLVAIMTFAQLLPERYEDADFRTQFSQIVCDEVERLNQIIDQINQFAHPRQLEFQPLDIRQALQKGLDAALQSQTQNGVWVDTALDENLPAVGGDDRALAECFAHLIRNAMEALARSENPRIVVSAREYQDGEFAHGVAVSVQDNGRGIPAELRGKVFSPFCTTKARGMGLGLPIVKRTIVDHNGRVTIDSDEKGTCVTVILPAAQHEAKHETHPDRRRRTRKS